MIGVPVQVYESAPELRPFGLGINLQPNAVRELHDLGLADELAAIGVDTREVALVRRDGTDVWSETRGIEAGYRWPQYSVHRGELEMMLYRAAVERLGPEAIVTGHSVTGYEHSIGGVHVELLSRDGTTQRIETPVLLGADGLHSAVRSRMFPGEGDPRWGGAVLWRGATPGPPIRDGASFLFLEGAATVGVAPPPSISLQKRPDVEPGAADQKDDPTASVDLARGRARASRL